MDNIEQNIELKITINAAGQIAVTGPIANEMVCYFLLEKARQAVAAHHVAAQRLVQPASAFALPPPRRD